MRPQELGKYSPQLINSIETLHHLNLDEGAGAGLPLLPWVITKLHLGSHLQIYNRVQARRIEGFSHTVYFTI